jgi:L-asparaginase / beta-aspartyl-peptidase
MIRYGIVVHGGAGSSTRLNGACKPACEAGFRLLMEGATAVEAVVEAARIMEDDGRFNAGCGSVLRLDGKTVEMDASVMDSKGVIGAVVSIRNVKNPVLVARAVMDTPHIALSGEGARLFARRHRFPRHVVDPRARVRYEKLLGEIRSGRLAKRDPRWKECDLPGLWNFDTPYKKVFVDTIGAVAMDRHGSMAVAASTGGASPMLLGRVGDTPMVGSGFYAGPHGAVTATGIGEEIVKRVLSKAVYDGLAEGKDVNDACGDGLGLFPRTVPIGIIAITPRGYSVCANRRMAHCVRVAGH